MFCNRSDSRYNHAAMIMYHDGVITVSWKNAPVSEDTPGQRVLMAQSVDGAHWGAPQILFPNMSTAETPAAQFAGPFAAVGGRLYATATPAVIADGDAQGAQWCLWPDGLDPRNCATPDRPGTQPSGILMMRRVFPAAAATGAAAGAGAPPAPAPAPARLGPVFWASADGPRPNVFAAAAAANGVLALSETDAQTQADVAAIKAGFHGQQPQRKPGEDMDMLPCDRAAATVMRWRAHSCRLERHSRALVERAPAS